MDGWRNIAIALIVPRKGEQTAQSCVNAWFRQLGGTPSRYNPAQGGPTKTGETSASRPGLATPCQSTRPTHSLRCTHSPWPTASRLDSRPQWKRPGGRAESTTPCRRGRRVPALCNWLLPTALIGAPGHGPNASIGSAQCEQFLARLGIFTSIPGFLRQ